MLQTNPVVMPENKVVFKKGYNNTIYVYLTLRAYRNTKGKATSEEVVIGKKDIKSGMLIPNQNYYKYFKGPVSNDPFPAIDISSASSFKFYENKQFYVLDAIAENINLKKTLQKTFPDNYQKFLALAYYMVCQGNIMMYLSDWLEFIETDLTGLDDRMASKLFASITDEKRMIFFKLWIKDRTENEYLAYDVTSISTYSKNIDMAEMGYNRDNEYLQQVNIGMYYGASSNLPVYYNLYSGSITDKTYLVFILENTERLGIRKVKFVLDRGFITEDNLQYMLSNNYSYIIPMPSSRKEFRHLVFSNKDQLKKHRNWIKCFNIYGMKIDCNLGKLKMKAHLFFSQSKCAEDELIFYNYLDRLEKDLNKINDRKNIGKRFTDFFEIEGNYLSKIKYKLNDEKVDNDLIEAGVFIILTNDPTISSEEILKIYRNRDIIEKAFDSLKNHLDFNRLRTHQNETTDGKFFVGFISLILQSYMIGKLKKYEETAKLSFKKILIELSKIKTIVVNGFPSITTPLTRTQKNILKALDVSDKKIIS